MTAREYLQQYRDAERQINAKLEHISQLRALATKTTVTLTGDSVNVSTTDKTAAIVSKIVDAERAVDASIDKLLEVKRDIEDTIEAVPGSRPRIVLHLHYICGFSFERVAVQLDKSWRQVIRWHGYGLEAVKKIKNF